MRTCVEDFDHENLLILAIKFCPAHLSLFTSKLTDPDFTADILVGAPKCADTVLMAAIRYSHQVPFDELKSIIDKVETLKYHPKLPEILVKTDENQMNALMLAAQNKYAYGATSILKLLKELEGECKNTILTQCNDKDQNSLVIAAHNKQWSIVESILESLNEADVELRKKVISDFCQHYQISAIPNESVTKNKLIAAISCLEPKESILYLRNNHQPFDALRIALASNHPSKNETYGLWCA